jgi:hypothetical protein
MYNKTDFKNNLFSFSFWIDENKSDLVRATTQAQSPTKMEGLQSRLRQYEWKPRQGGSSIARFKE